jgi:sugar transferase (PEP-CTERM/EpsH1 system associated)
MNAKSSTILPPGQTEVQDSPFPLILHLIYRLDVGGLENGLVNLVNSVPAQRYRHLIVSLTDATAFRRRITRPDVEVVELHKRAGQDWSIYGRLWALFRRYRPSILHTRNLAALEGQLPAFFARIPHRVHSEHGLEMKGARYTLLRKALRGFVDVYIPLSRDLEKWLAGTIGVPQRKIVQIYNGVDTNRFQPRSASGRPALSPDFAPDGCVVLGTVGRLARIKDQATLISAFSRLVERTPEARRWLRLVVVGDGEMRDQLREAVRNTGINELTWLPGTLENIPDLLRSLDLFVLPSISEGVSNSILEAMASGLPVVATTVGGNPELVSDGVTGRLVPSRDPEALAAALAEYLDNPGLLSRHGTAGRQRCVELFSIDTMVDRYLSVYDALLAQRPQALRQWQISPSSRS